MALRDQPYLPLYVQDFLTDEKLMECSASSTGVYIRIMCVMHKSEEYGKILLKQKDKQTDDQIENFALKLARHLPYDLPTVLAALVELCNEKCLVIEGDFLIQKRMVCDGELSIKRSLSGKKGGETTQESNRKFALAKPKANSESENEYVLRVLDSLEKNQSLNGESPSEKNALGMLIIDMEKIWMKNKPEYSAMQMVDYPALLNIAYHIAGRKGWTKHSVTDIREQDVVNSWEKIVLFLCSSNADNFLKRQTLDGIANPKIMQKIEEAMNQMISKKQKGMIL